MLLVAAVVVVVASFFIVAARDYTESPRARVAVGVACVYGYVHNDEIAAAADPHAGGRPYGSATGQWPHYCGWSYNDLVVARYHTGMYGAMIIDDCR